MNTTTTENRRPRAGGSPCHRSRAIAAGRRGAAAMLAAGLLAPLPAAAQQQQPETGWFDTAELSFVATAGNAESTTIGFSNTLRRVWPEARFKLEAGGLRAETTDLERRAIGTSSADFRTVEESTTRLSAESYYLRGRYERQVSERLFWFGGAGWERNRFAGFDRRASLVAGAGHVWRDGERLAFSTDYGATYTAEEDLAGGDEGFAGVRLGYDLRWRATETTTVTSRLAVDENLDDTGDLRAELEEGVAVAISERLALKVALTLLYDRRPGFVAVPLELPEGGATGETVPVRLDELDSTLKVALVVDF